jgi:hypothetical protein
VLVGVCVGVGVGTVILFTGSGTSLLPMLSHSTPRTRRLCRLAPFHR